MSTEKFEHWCLVELYGHNRIVGKVTEATIGGCSFVRVDVPEVGERQACTRYFGNGAIYAINPMSEEAAMLLLEQIAEEPPIAWSVTNALRSKVRELVAHEDDDDDLPY